MNKNTHRISEIQEMIRRHEEAIKSQNPAGHDVRDEDLSKVASIEFIGKSDPTDELKK